MDRLHYICQFSSVAQFVWLFATPWTATCQASLSITNSWSLLKLMTIESVMSSNHLILCHPLLLLPSIFPIIRVFPNESVLHIRWPKYWSFSFSISPSNEYSGLIFFRIDWMISLLSKGLSRVFSNTTAENHQFFSAQLFLQNLPGKQETWIWLLGLEDTLEKEMATHYSILALRIPWRGAW